MGYFRVVMMLKCKTGQLRVTDGYHNMICGLCFLQNDERVIYTCAYDRLLRARG